MSERANTNVTVKNRLGMHARPAMTLVDTASAWGCAITLRRTDGEGDAVDGKSIMQVLMLAATQGTEIEIVCEGADAEQACSSLRELFESGFGEE